MKQEALTSEELARLIDHTFLKASGVRADIESLCEEAKQYEFAAVAVNPSEVATCAKFLAGCKTKVCAAIGFPLGQNLISTKLFEMEKAADDGALELDMVINQRALIAGDLNLVKEELGRFAEFCQKRNLVSKVILECCNLTDAQKIQACQIADAAGCNFVKTSTGFGSGGATSSDVSLMRQNVSQAVQVKASGGIRTLEATLEMISAGATRIGTSAGPAILKQFESSQSGLGLITVEQGQNY